MLKTKEGAGEKPNPRPRQADQDGATTWTLTTRRGRKVQVPSTHRDEKGNGPHDILSA